MWVFCANYLMATGVTMMAVWLGHWFLCRLCKNKQEDEWLEALWGRVDEDARDLIMEMIGKISMTIFALVCLIRFTKYVWISEFD